MIESLINSLCARARQWARHSVRNRLFSYSLAAASGSAMWAALMGFLFHTGLNHYTHASRDAILWFSALGVIALGGSFVLMHIIQRIVRKELEPLDQLTAIAEAYAAGEHPTGSAALLRRHDEVGALTRALQRILHQVQDTRSELEERFESHSKELAAAETLMRLKDRALEASAHGITISDMCAPGQPIIYVNPAFERITGYKAIDVIGHNCRFLQGAETEPETLSSLRNSIALGEETTVQIRNYRADGRSFWNELSLAPVLNEAGDVTHYIGIQNDITLKRESEQQLFEWFVRLETIFTLSPDGFVSFDHEGRIAYVNPAFERMLGLNAGDLLGITLEALDQLVRERAEPGSYPGLQHVQQADAAEATSDLIVLTHPVKRTVQWSWRDCAAHAASLVLYFRDVTRETEVDRMKSDFLSTAAHELRTPMASIMGFSELLLARRFNEDRTRDMLETINRQSVRLTQLLNELLDLARIEARAGKDFQVTQQPLASIVQETLRSLMLPEKHTLDVKLSESLPEVMIDTAKMQQALTNIFSNAIKYSPQGGEIRVRSTQRSLDGRDQIGVEVQDQGIGMTAEQLARAFERFYRADSSCNIPGTGLGLSLVKEIVELHKGQIEIDSQAGRGTRVTLWLPVAAAPAITLWDDTPDPQPNYDHTSEAA